MSFITDTLSGWAGVNITPTTDAISKGATNSTGGVAAGMGATANPVPVRGFMSSPYFIPALLIGAVLVFFMFKKG